MLELDSKETVKKPKKNITLEKFNSPSKGDSLCNF